MTINDPEKYVRSLWDWGILDGCFGDTRIKPTDIDGLVERKGKFLFIECKEPGVEVKDGQEIMHNSLIKTGVFTVFIIWGYANDPEKIRIRTLKQDKVYESADLELLRELVMRWYSWVER